MRHRIAALFAEVDALAREAGRLTGNRTVRKNLSRAANSLRGALHALDAHRSTRSEHG